MKPSEKPAKLFWEVTGCGNCNEVVLVLGSSNKDGSVRSFRDRYGLFLNCQSGLEEFAMADGSRETDFKSFFTEFVGIQRKREQGVRMEVIPCLKSKEIPTPAGVREAINFSVGEERQDLLRHHVHWKERQLRLGLDSLIRAAHRAYVDICRHDAALGSLARKSDFEDHVDYTVGYAAQKDMVAYCALVVGVKQTLGDIKSERSDVANRIANLESEFLSNDVTSFVHELRNNLLHGMVVVPKWKIFYDVEDQSSSGSMTYAARELSKAGRWKANGSKRYLSNATDGTINLSGVVGEHHKCLEDFDRKIQDLFARNVSAAEKDFFEIEDSHKRIQRRQWAKILISQIGKKKDPYEYLHRYFDPETVREILRLPGHSKEQVDFIIGLKAAELDFDDDLRNLLYKQFGVTDPSST